LQERPSAWRRELDRDIIGTIDVNRVKKLRFALPRMLSGQLQTFRNHRLNQYFLTGTSRVVSTVRCQLCTVATVGFDLPGVSCRGPGIFMLSLAIRFRKGEALSTARSATYLDSITL
jgi:hypothetical protein